MANTNIRLGLTGGLNFNGTLVPCSNLDAFVETGVEYYDHTVGLLDTIPVGFSEYKGVGTDADHAQKLAFRFSPEVPRGTASGPVTTGAGFNDILDAALNFTKLSYINFHYADSLGSFKLINAYVENLDFSVQAGDVLSFNASFLALDFEDLAGDIGEFACSKIVTWDQVNVTSALGDEDLYSIDVSINNAPQIIHTAGNSSLLPSVIRPGMQEVKGTIGTYNTDRVDKWGGGSGKTAPAIDTIEIEIPSENGSTLTIDIEAVYEPGKAQINPGTFVSVVPFRGVSDSDDSNLWSL